MVSLAEMSISDNTLKSQADIDVIGEVSQGIHFDQNNGVGFDLDGLHRGSQSTNWTNLNLDIAQSDGQMLEYVEEVDYDELMEQIDAMGDCPIMEENEEKEIGEFDYLFEDNEDEASTQLSTNTLPVCDVQVVSSQLTNSSPHNPDSEQNLPSTNSPGNTMEAVTHHSTLTFPQAIPARAPSGSSVNTDQGSPFSSGTVSATTHPSPLSPILDYPLEQMDVAFDLFSSVDFTAAPSSTSNVDLTQEDSVAPTTRSSVHIDVGQNKLSGRKTRRGDQEKRDGEIVINSLIQEHQRHHVASALGIHLINPSRQNFSNQLRLDTRSGGLAILETPVELFDCSTMPAGSIKTLFEEASRLKEENRNLHASVEGLRAANSTLEHIQKLDQKNGLKTMYMQLCAKSEEVRTLEHQREVLRKFNYLQSNEKQKALIAAWDDKMMQYSDKIGKQDFDDRVKEQKVEKLSKELKEKVDLASARTEIIVKQAEELTRKTSEIEQWKSKYAALNARFSKLEKRKAASSNSSCQDPNHVNFQIVLTKSMEDNKKLAVQVVKLKKAQEMMDAILKNAVAQAKKRKLNNAKSTPTPLQLAPSRRPNFNLHISSSTTDTSDQ